MVMKRHGEIGTDCIYKPSILHLPGTVFVSNLFERFQSDVQSKENVLAGIVSKITASSFTEY